MLTDLYGNSVLARLLKHKTVGFFIDEENNNQVSLLVKQDVLQTTANLKHQNLVASKYIAFPLDEVLKPHSPQSILHDMSKRLNRECEPSQQRYLEDAMKELISNPKDEKGFRPPLLRNIPLADMADVAKYHSDTAAEKMTLAKDELATEVQRREAKTNLKLVA